MQTEYGLAYWDRFKNCVYEDNHAPLKLQVESGRLHEFLHAAGLDGWELCGSLPYSTPGDKAFDPDYDRQRMTSHENEHFLLVFKRSVSNLT